LQGTLQPFLQFGALYPECLGKARAGIEHMRDEGDFVSRDILKNLRWSIVAQHQNRGELEARVNLAGYAMHFAAPVQGCNETAEALIQIFLSKARYVERCSFNPAAGA
jgi:hypothetical protein